MKSKFTNPFRILAWGMALILLLIPLIAMQFTDEVLWTSYDFIVMGLLIACVGLAIEKAVSLSSDTTFRIGAAILILSVFLLIWVNLAVGIIGSEKNIYNMLYLLIPITGLLIAMKGKFKAKSMVSCALSMSLIQLFISFFAIYLLWDSAESNAAVLLIGNGIFIALYLFSASFFYRAYSRLDVSKLDR